MYTARKIYVSFSAGVRNLDTKFHINTKIWFITENHVYTKNHNQIRIVMRLGLNETLLNIIIWVFFYCSWIFRQLRLKLYLQPAERRRRWRRHWNRRQWPFLSRFEESCLHSRLWWQSPREREVVLATIKIIINITTYLQYTCDSSLKEKSHDMHGP